MYHDFWLVLKNYHLAISELAPVYCITSDNFPESEVAISEERVEKCSITGFNFYNEIKDFTEEKNALKFYLPPIFEEGTYLVEQVLKSRIIEIEDKLFKSYLEHKCLKELKQIQRTQKEEYTKFAKAIIQVGDKRNDTFREILKHKIEIVPQENPYNLKNRDLLSVKVLYDEKPIEFLPVFYGNSKEMGKIYKTQTDKYGSCVVKLSSGIFYINSINMILSEKEGIDYESFWASLTFEVL